MGIEKKIKMIKIDDTQYEIGITSPTCNSCVNLESSIDRKCVAFPNGIPMYIWKGENDHKTSVEGDNGIVFTKKE